MAWFQGLRAIVYLRRIAEALERVAAYTDSQMPAVPKRSKRGAVPETEVMRPSVKEWNQRWREDNPDDYERMRDDV
jgi:hypothetical protein